MVPAPLREAKGDRDPAGPAEAHGESRGPAHDGDGRGKEDLSFTSNYFLAKPGKARPRVPSHTEARAMQEWL